MKKIAVTAVVALLLTACTQKVATSTDVNTASSQPVASAAIATAPPTEAVGSRVLSFKVDALNNSQQEGTATLEEVDGKIKVTLNLGGGVTTTEPAHIHTGSCPTPGDVKYTLTNVVNGKSQTTLPDSVSLSALQDMGPLAVNVHKSTADLKTYVACGNLDWKTATKGDAMMPAGSPNTMTSAEPKASTGVMKQ